MVSLPGVTVTNMKVIFKMDTDLVKVNILMKVEQSIPEIIKIMKAMVMVN